MHSIALALLVFLCCSGSSPPLKNRSAVDATWSQLECVPLQFLCSLTGWLSLGLFYAFIILLRCWTDSNWNVSHVGKNMTTTEGVALAPADLVSLKVFLGPICVVRDAPRLWGLVRDLESCFMLEVEAALPWRLAASLWASCSSLFKSWIPCCVFPSVPDCYLFFRSISSRTSRHL